MNTPPDQGSNAAIVIDQWELFRLGIENVISHMDFRVIGSTSRANDGVRMARSGASEILIVGKAPDLKHLNALKVIKSLKDAPKVVFLLEQAGQQEVARLISHGADALLLRTVSGDDLADAISGVMAGERVVAPGLASGAIGRVGPAMNITALEASDKSGLSPRELDVLGELASGATYDEIATALVVTKATVKTHLIHIYDKLEVKNRNEAVARAIALGVLS